MVALPTELVPLHIFEERYKTMIGECLERESEFGIVWLSDDGLRAGRLRLRDRRRCWPRMEDGRHEHHHPRHAPVPQSCARQDELAYPAGEIELLDDVEEEPDARRPRAGSGGLSPTLVEQATDEAPRTRTWRS